MSFSKKIVKLVLDIKFKQNFFCTSSKESKKKLKKLLSTFEIDKMPRNTTHIVEAQKQRLKIKERSSRFVPGTVNLVVVGSGALGSPASVYLFTDQTRYLFNCGEGTQRLAHEYKTRLSRLEHIFMTQTNWQHIGGLPGLSLTVQDAGVPHLTLHGPPGLDEIFYAMRRFVVLKDLKVDAPICKLNGFFEDSVMTVNYIPIFKNQQQNDRTDNNTNIASASSTTKNTFDDDTDYYAHETKGKILLNIPKRKFLKKAIPQQEKHSVMAYVCKIKPRAGALSLEKCVDKGVPAGPLLGQLKRGENVTLPNGNIVYAHEVCQADDPGAIFIIIDIPSTDYTENFTEISDSIFQIYQSKAKKETDVASLVIHFSPQNIIESKFYRDFMDKFSPSTKHLLLNETNQFSGYLSAHRIQHQLNQLSENVFPLLKENSSDSDWAVSVCKKQKTDKFDTNAFENSVTTSNWELANSMTCYHLRPKKGLDRTSEQYINSHEYIREATILPGFTEALNDLKQKLNIQFIKDIEKRTEMYPKIVFLGTGSCVPNKTRNVSSILIHTRDDSCILFDCGEGTTGQIIRFYGCDKTIDIFKKLKAIYISHLHADHHIGLIGMLKMRQRLLGSDTTPLLLFAPEQINSWLNYYDQNIETIKNQFHLISNGYLIDNNLSDEYLNILNLSAIRTCLVKHCPYSYGITITFNTSINDNTDFKITYSGDTMPCDELIKIGKQSTILIHESTMEDELINEAAFKMHSTLSQAIEQGRKMDAKYIILTHFSQRYAKLPRIDEKKSLNNNISIAFDNMEITELDLNYFNLFYPTLKLLFAEHCEEMEQKAIKRATKKQRLAELLETENDTLQNVSNKMNIN